MVLLRICVILILDLIIGLYSRFFPFPSPTADEPRVRLIKSSQDIKRYNVFISYQVRFSYFSINFLFMYIL